MPDIFLSYSREDQATARRYAEAFEGAGFSVWWDVTLRSGEAYDKVTEKALKEARAVVVLWSPRSAESHWVRSEATLAHRRGTLVPVTIEACERPIMFELTQTAELAHWKGEAKDKAWLAFLADVRGFVDTGGGPPAASAPAMASAAERSPPKLSIAVLPFVNMSDDPQQEYFSDGISEDIITDLSKVSALQVAARNTAFTFKGKAVKATDVAGELNVSHVLEGSVRKAGGRVRITAQLIDGATGNHLWAERYDRDLTDIFALQDEISEAIVKALKLKLLPEEKKAIEQRGTTNLDAYNLYLLARRQWTSGNIGDSRREEAILRLCGRAIEIDPDYPQAWALTALAQWSLRFNRGRTGDDGLAAAERALSLDPTLAEPHSVRARVLANQGHRDQAAAELAIALRLNPESDEVNLAAANMALSQNRLEEAVAYFTKAETLVETDYSSSGMLVSCYTALGDKEGAVRAAKVALERVEKAVAVDQSNGQAMATGVFSLAALGEAERAREWIDRALVIDPENMLMRYNFACALCLHLDDADAALAMLGAVFDNISLGMFATAKTDPDLDRLRTDPRFAAMLAEAEVRVAAASGAASAG